MRFGPRPRSLKASTLVVLAAFAAPRALSAVADQPTAGEPEPTVGVITGDKVNLRVGPRIDDAPVDSLEQGAVVVIVERAGEWLGVRVPAGFAAAVAGALTETVDADHVRIQGTLVNLRVRPPAGDRAFPAFRDHPTAGAVLPVTAREGDWVWVEAPEEVRVYVSAQYVKEVGSLSANAERVAAARHARAVRERMRASIKKRTQEAGDDAAVRAEVGAVGAALVNERTAGGYDTAPLALLADRLSSCVEAHPAVDARTKAIVAALAKDLERETELRVAYGDELLLAKRTGKRAPGGVQAPAPRVDALEASGTLRFEPAPGWEGGGAFLLWAPDGKPIHAVRWGGHDLKPFDGKSVKIRGKALGGRLLGLPAVEADSVVATGG
jgi:SH3-like domain-containing protein